MSGLQLQTEDRVLILGGTGFIGKRLVKELAEKNIKLRLLARNPSKAAHIIPAGKDVEILAGDLMEKKSLEEALHGIHSCYYLLKKQYYLNPHPTELMLRNHV